MQPNPFVKNFAFSCYSAAGLSVEQGFHGLSTDVFVFIPDGNWFVNCFFRKKIHV